MPKYEDKSQKISNKLKSDFAVKIEKKLYDLFEKIRTTKHYSEFVNLKQITKELEHDILYPSKELAERFLDVKISRFRNKWRNTYYGVAHKHHFRFMASS